MKEHQMEDFLEKYPDIIEEGLSILERQQKIGLGYVDLLCKDKNNKYVIVELKLEPSPESVAQVARYVLALEKKGISKDKIRGILVAQFIDEETQELCDYFNIESKGLSLGKPKRAITKSINLSHSNSEKLFHVNNREPRNEESPIFPDYNLTLAESTVVKTILSHNEEDKCPQHSEIANSMNISMGAIRSYMSSIVSKGVPVIKKKNRKGEIFFFIERQKAQN